jgi:hypothetical protein
MDVASVLLKVLDVANPLAGMAAEFIAGKLGLGEKTIDAVQQVVSGMTGSDQVKLKQIAADMQDHLAQYGVQLQIAEISAGAAMVTSVNATLQADALGSTWLQQNHHAVESLITVGLMVAVYFVLPLTHVTVPIVPGEAFMMLGAILGVTAWQRGVVNQTIAAKA